MVVCKSRNGWGNPARSDVIHLASDEETRPSASSYTSSDPNQFLDWADVDYKVLTYWKSVFYINLQTIIIIWKDLIYDDPKVVLGKGGYGIVYRTAKNSFRGKTAAVKILHAQLQGKIMLNKKKITNLV